MLTLLNECFVCLTYSLFFFCKQNAAYEIYYGLVGSEMCIRDRMNAMMSETLNIGGALLVKLFGRKRLEEERFGERGGQVRFFGIQRAVTGSAFFAIVGPRREVGTALVYGCVLFTFDAARRRLRVGARGCPTIKKQKL